MLDLLDLLKEEGKDNAPGLKTKVFFAPEGYFDTIAAPGADGVTITGPHVFKAGKGFVELYVTLDTAEFKMDTIGERDSRGMSINLPMSHPGNSKAAATFASVVKSAPGILLIEEMDGTVIQLGSEGLGVEIAGAYGSGKVSGGSRGWIFTATGFQSNMLYYEGAIPLKRDAVVTP